MTDNSRAPAGLYCVVPAAGRSSRMGAWKPLLPWGATTVCGAVVDAVLAAGVRPVLVAGYRAPELVAFFSGRPGVAVVENPDWERGMTGSIRTGLDAVAAMQAAVSVAGGAGSGPAGCFVAPADMPRLPPAAFALVAAAAAGLEAGGTPMTVFAARAGRLGHPVWITAAAFDGIAGLDPGARLRDYLLGLPWSSAEVDDDGIFADLDTPEAYAAESLRSH